MRPQRFLIYILGISLALVLHPGFAQGSGVSPGDSGPSRMKAPAIVDGAAQPLPPNFSSDWWTSVQENIEQAEYQITWQNQTYLPNLVSAYQAPNRAHNLRTYFTPAGPHIISRSSSAPEVTWEWHLALTGYGYAGEIQSVAPAELMVAGNRIEYHRGELIEWYLNTPQGLEQGFTLTSPPLLRSSTPLLLKLALSGTLTPVLSDGGQTVELITSAGVQVLRYSNLHAYDATGRELAAHLAIQDSALTIDVDTTAAVYPVTIDPLATSPNWTAEGNQPSAFFGYSVNTAGDVNGDGYDDVIIGAPGYDNGQKEEGRALVYYGSAGGLSTTLSWRAESNQAGANFGSTVSPAGDVNGDGYADVMIGTSKYDNGQTDEGMAFVWYGSSSGLGPNGTPTNTDWKAESNQVNSFFGSAIGTAGDVNDDGYDDIIIGAYRYNNGQRAEGRVFVWYGSGSGLGTRGVPANADWTAESNQEGARLGASVGSAGDVNGDGYADIIIGATKYDNGQMDEGHVFIWHGGRSGLGSKGTPANADWKAEGNQKNAFFGSAVGPAGDVNHDGYADIIVGAALYDNGQSDEGQAFVWYGSSGGLGAKGSPANADWKTELRQAGAWLGSSVGTAGDVNGDSYDDVIIGARFYQSSHVLVGGAFIYYGSAAGLRSTTGWMVKGDQAETNFGWPAQTAGDVNGDGYGDVIIGACTYDNDQVSEGRVFVYYGAAPMDFNPPPDWMVEGDQEDGRFGFAVNTAGDVNNDGYEDVIVGANRYDNHQESKGRVFVYYGSATGLNTEPAWIAENDPGRDGFGNAVGTAGDVNNDGYADVIVGDHTYADEDGSWGDGRVFVYHGSATGLSLTPNWTAENNQGVATFFGHSVSTAGDVNGDGYDDVIIGTYAHEIDAMRVTQASTNPGVFVYYGSAGGLSLTPDWIIGSDQSEAFFGYSVSTAGDVNNDGYADVIIGRYGNNSGDLDQGRAFVYHGSTTGLSLTPNWRFEGEQAGAAFGYAVDTAGDINHDGYSDVIIGAPYHDNGQEDEGRVFAYYGSAAGLSPAINWMAESNQVRARLGSAVSTAGDVNNDSYDDIIIGAYDYNHGQEDEGAAFIYLGAATGLSSTVNWMAESNQGNCWLGGSVNTAGDVNNDGYAEIIIGAELYKNSYWGQGGAALYEGNAEMGSRLPVTELSASSVTATFDWQIYLPFIIK